MCNQQFTPKSGEVKGVVGICHGFTDHTHGFLMEFAIKLCSDGFVVITMDLEGHGLSDGVHCAVHDLNLLATDLCDYFLDQLDSPSLADKPFFLYGVSMGGANAFNLCTLPSCQRLQEKVSGAILCAPMVKIAEDMKPPGLVISAMGWLASLFPLAPVTPVPELLSKCFRDPTVYDRAIRHPLLYSHRPRLKTGLALLSATEDINARMEHLRVPVLLLHGGDDRVTDPKLTEVLHKRCSSVDKTLNIYPKAWHDMLAGEPEYMKKIVYADILSWLTTRCASATEE